MEKKQTAVEWLVEQIKSDQNQKALSASEWMGVIEQAKEMEKNLIIDSFGAGIEEGIGCRTLSPKQYYKETYGK